MIVNQSYESPLLLIKIFVNINEANQKKQFFIKKVIVLGEFQISLGKYCQESLKLCMV